MPRCACWAHSSPHSLQEVAHACKMARAICGSNAVSRDMIRPVAVHTSAQSASSRIQRTNILGSCSPRQASAHAVHACAQSKHALMHSASTSCGIVTLLGLVWIILSATAMSSVSFHQLLPAGLFQTYQTYPPGPEAVTLRGRPARRD